MKTVIKVILRTFIILVFAGVVSAAMIAIAPSLAPAGFGRGRFEGGFEGRQPPSANANGNAVGGIQLPNFGEGRRPDGGRGERGERGERGGNRDGFNFSAFAMQPLIKNFVIMAAITVPFAGWAVYSKNRRRAQHGPKVASS